MAEADRVATSPGFLTRPSATPLSERRGRLVLASLLIGTLIAVLWSAQLVDDDIGLNTANSLLGHDATTTSIGGTFAGLAFAFVTGLAGTFTACNVAVFSAITPMVENRSTAADRMKQALRPLMWLALGAIVVSGVYGAIGALAGHHIPALSTATFGAKHYPVRILQSMGVFAVIGIAMLYLGLAQLRLVPDPLARATARWEHTPQVAMGVLIGAFLIGRPWGLFHKMFQHAADTHNPFFGAASFILVVIGNLLVMGLLFLLLAASRFPQWLRADPGRIARVTAVALLIGGAFTFVYWGVRLPAKLGYGWFPTMPWS